MSLIHQSQLGEINVSKITGMVKTVTQKIIAADKQTSFTFTKLDENVKIVNCCMEINGIPYYEIKEGNMDGAFSRSPNGLTFYWEFTADNDGFDIEEGMEVILKIDYIAADSDFYTSTKAIPLTGVESVKQVIGNYEEDPQNYFEIINLNSLNIKRFEEFLGLNVNGIFYCHPAIVSYNDKNHTISIAGLKLLDTDIINLLVLKAAV